MIIITDSQGNIQTPTITENVYQGSNNANNIVFLAPLPKSNMASITFRLPNGDVTERYFMTPYQDIPSQYELNGWIIQINKVVTQYYGEVEFQIDVTNATGQQVTTIQSTFPVLRGVAPLPSSEPSKDTYDEILEYLSALSGKIVTGDLVSKGIQPYDSTFNYGINNIVIYGSTFYKSLIDNNVGNNPATSNSWQPIYATIPPASIDVLGGLFAWLSLDNKLFLSTNNPADTQVFYEGLPDGSVQAIISTSAEHIETNTLEDGSTEYIIGGIL